MKLFPSILSADFACLEREIKNVFKAGVSQFHLDIMDGHFVPNISFGIPVIRSLTDEFPDLTWDAHLMIEHPEQYISDFLDLGMDMVSVHVESNTDLDLMRQETLQENTQLGLAFNPNTTLNKITPHLEKIDFVLAMTVQPGFGGQSFREDVLPKIERLRKQFDGPIQVDGGVGPETVNMAVDAGANWFVSGSSIFNQETPGEAAQSMMQQIEGNSSLSR